MRWAASLSTASVLLALGGGCLAPLPEPTSCDAPARIQDGVCVPCDPPLRWVGDECIACPPAPAIEYSRCIPNAITDFGGGVPNGCLASDLNFDRFSCVRRAGDDCSCAAPSDDAPPTCFSDSVCPDKVTAIPDVTAQCLPLSPSNVRWEGGVPAQDGCACGCIGDIARCDGKGIVLGNFLDDTSPVPFKQVQLEIDLEEALGGKQGRLGLYIRARGFAIPLVASFSPISESFKWTFYITGDYAEQIGYGPDQDGIDQTLMFQGPYHFDKTNAPTQLLIGLPEVPAGVGAANAIEIDCVIPFVVPD